MLEVGDRLDGRGGVGDDDRVGGSTERGGDRGLVAVVDVEERGHRAEQAADLVGRGEQRAGAVLAVEADLERVAARDEAGALALGLLRVLAGPGELLVDLVEGGHGVLVLGVETLLAGVEPGDPGLERGEVALRPLGAGHGFLAGVGEPLDLGVRRLRAGRQGVDLAGEAREALAPVGGCPLEPRDALVLLGRGLLGRALGDHGGVEVRALLLDLLGDLGLLAAHALGLGLEVVGVAAGVDRVALGGTCRVADPLVGQRRGAAQPLLEPGQGEPGLLRRGQAGQVVAQGGLEPGLLLAPGGDLRLDLLAPLQEQRLVGHLGLERGAGGDEVVGEEAGAGVAHVGLHGLRLPGDLGLPAERLELATDLREQVGQTGQVAVGGVELAERLLLALAVLEDAGGLLDEAATVLGGGVQDRVELSLPDDDVHLAADAGVAEQLLHVEQPAPGAVDGVLRAAVAEHRAADRDLGVVDRQRAVGVVDGQLHLGAAQRRAAGRAGEDDVLHLAAAQALGALLAHHPGEGVDDVGLARSVGTDDAGDARLELHGRRGREGLEPLEGQALQVQRGLLTGSRRPLTTGEAQRGSPYDTRRRSRPLHAAWHRAMLGRCGARSSPSPRPWPSSPRSSRRHRSSPRRHRPSRSPGRTSSRSRTTSSSTPTCAIRCAP